MYFGRTLSKLWLKHVHKLNKWFKVYQRNHKLEMRSKCVVISYRINWKRDKPPPKKISRIYLASWNRCNKTLFLKCLLMVMLKKAYAKKKMADWCMISYFCVKWWNWQQLYIISTPNLCQGLDLDEKKLLTSVIFMLQVSTFWGI